MKQRFKNVPQPHNLPEVGPPLGDRAEMWISACLTLTLYNYCPGVHLVFPLHLYNKGTEAQVAYHKRQSWDWNQALFQFNVLSTTIPLDQSYLGIQFPRPLATLSGSYIVMVLSNQATGILMRLLPAPTQPSRRGQSCAHKHACPTLSFFLKPERLILQRMFA